MESIVRKAVRELKTFAQWWLAEAEAVAAGDKSSAVAEQGLCILMAKLGMDARSMAAMLMRNEKGCDTDYPFNFGPRHYDDEVDNRTMHLNPKRIGFVKSMLDLSDN